MLGKAQQARQATLRGIFGQHAVAIESAAQTDGFLDVFDALVTPLEDLADFQAEAVGAHVDGGQQVRMAALLQIGGWGFARLGGLHLVHGRYCRCFA